MVVQIVMCESGGPTATGRIYVNGSAVGTERVATTTTYEAFSENIAVTSGDNVQLYVKVSSNIGYVHYFRITCNDARLATIVTD